MEITNIILSINHLIWSWPLLIFIMTVAVAATVSLNFIQLRQFCAAWKLILFSNETGTSGDMSPFQAFLNILSTSIGNGSIAGIATAVYAGGPGAAFWIFVFGLLSMALRFAEVFLANYYAPIQDKEGTIGGPMIYLQKVPGGKILSTLFALFLLSLGLTSGSAMQANSIRFGFARILNVPPLAVAIVLLIFITYVMTGGAKRIVEVSDKIVPIKVGLFFISSLIVLGYHYQAFIPALKLIFLGAFDPKAIAGGATGYLIQSAMRYGIVRSVNATEAGLGTAGVLFGGTGSKEPINNGLMSMISAFISANLVCFMVALMIIMSGVWNNGQNGLDLTISAYETVFGVLGGWVVTLLSVSFGMGVLVAYGYIARSCWLFLTSGRWGRIFDFIFCAMTFLGAIANLEMVWNAVDIVNGGLLLVNLWGIAYFLPMIRSIVIKKSA